MAELIITLSSIPPRFAQLQPTLKSLLNQRIPAKEIRVHIPYQYRRFPQWDGNLPTVPEGVSIVRSKEDYGPATKILPAINHFRGQDVELLFCDDDRIYDQYWSTRFLAARALRPSCLIAEDGARGAALTDMPMPRATRREKDWRYRMVRVATLSLHRPPIWKTSGYASVFKGYGGALLRPEFLPAFAFETPEVLWTVDDTWLSGCLAANGVGIWIHANGPVSKERRIARRDALLRYTHLNHSRRKADAACRQWFKDQKNVSL